MSRPPGSAASGVVWNVLQYGGGRGVAFVSTLVLARLLSPEAFGLMAIGMLAINIFDRFKDLGVGQALVQQQRGWATLATTGRVLTTVTAIAVALAVILGAGPLASVLSGGSETDDLTPMIRALGGALLVSGLAVFPDAFLRRRMLFKERTPPELVGQVVKAGVSIGLALMNFGAWSLVWGQVAGTVATTGLYWLAYQRHSGPHEPDAGWDGTVAREMVRYGSSLSLVALLALVLDNLDYFVIGNRLGATELGYYTMAYRMPEMLVIGLCLVIGQVLFSSFSRTAGDRAALSANYVRATRIVSLATMPVAVGLAAAAEPAVHVLFGHEFEGSVRPLQALALMSGVYAMSFHAGEIYKATGHTGIMIRLALARLVVLVPSLWWAAGHSIIRVALVVLAVQALFVLVRLAIIRRVLDLSVREQTAALGPALLGGAVMFAAILGADRLAHELPDVARLAIAVVVGLAAFGVTVGLTAPSAVREARALLLRRTHAAS